MDLISLRRAVRWLRLGATLCLGAAAVTAAAASNPAAHGGVLTFATVGAGDPFAPTLVQDMDLRSGRLAVRFGGLEPSRSRSGETSYVARLAPGWTADHAVVVADAAGVPSAPLHVCKNYNWHDNANCGVPRISPDATRVAFVSRGGGGSFCRSGMSASMLWGDFVVVSDRRGQVLSRYEGYSHPEWLPDGRLLMMGTACRNAGIWAADAGLRTLTRIDQDRVRTPAAAPAVRPDGRQLAFIWNGQLWAMSLDGRAELTQLTHFARSVHAAAWSPDGTQLALLLFDVTMPNKSVVLMRAGDETSAQTLPLPVHPYGPISWR